MPSGVYKHKPNLFHLKCSVCKTGFFAGTTSAKYCPQCRPNWTQIKRDRRVPYIATCEICGVEFESRTSKRKICFSDHCKAIRNLKAQKVSRRQTKITFKAPTKKIQAKCPTCKNYHTIEIPEHIPERDAKHTYCPLHERNRGRYEYGGNAGYGVHL